jgi:hypothetical protein
VNESTDLNETVNMIKAVFTGGTLFLLAPILPLTYDFNTKFTLLARWSNGTQQEYKASCIVSAYGTYPYRSTVQKFNKSKSDATEKCLNAVINQITSEELQ